MTMRFSRRRSSFGALIGGLSAGAGFMFFLDPDRGTRRRAIARSRFSRLFHQLAHTADGAARDLEHRAEGVAAEVRSLFTPQAAPSDEVLVERVRARLGRAITHPRAIEVAAHDGRIQLAGAVLRDDVQRLMTAGRSVRGVRSIEDNLEVHDEPAGVPALQGPPRAIGRPPFLARRWMPATQFAVGALGTGLLFEGLRRRGIFGAAMALGGLGVALRAAQNGISGRFAAGDLGARGIDLHKTLTIHAPVGEVFGLLSNPRELPRILEHVRTVVPMGAGRSRWRIDGPAGFGIGFEAALTRFVPDSVIAWHTLPGASVVHEGALRLEAVDGGTRLDLRLRYRPPTGALGAAIATLLGGGPKAAIDEDMVRLKSLLEQGKATAHGETVTRDQLH